MREESSGATTEGEDCGEETSEGGDSVGQPIYVTAIFRPGHGSGSPPFMHSTHGASSRRWVEDVYTTWPRLRYTAWSHHDVHEAYNRDFPQFDLVRHKVLVTLQDLTSALHQVAFVVGSMMDITVVQAWPYPPRTSAFIVLFELGLWEMCAPMPDDCKVSVNGLILDLNEFRTLRHGDYILIRIAPTRGPDGRRRLRQAFGIPEDFEGLEYTTETGIARISGDGRRAQHGTPSLYHVPQTRTHQQLHEAYWLCMGTFAWIATMLLLRLQVCPEPNLPGGALKIKGHRHVVLGRRTKVRIPWVMLWLTISQPLIPAAQGLQFLQLEEFRSGPAHGDTVHQHVHDRCIGWRPVGHHEKLPPPGNPNSLVMDEEWDAHHINTFDFLQTGLTIHGQWLRRQLPMIYEAQDLRTKLAAVKSSIDCKVLTDTEFAPTSSDYAVGSTLPGKAEVSMPEDPVPKVDGMQRSSGLERSDDVDGFLPMASVTPTCLPTTGTGQRSRVVKRTTQVTTEDLAQTLGVVTWLHLELLNPRVLVLELDPTFVTTTTVSTTVGTCPFHQISENFQIYTLHHWHLCSSGIRRVPGFGTRRMSTGTFSQMAQLVDHPKIHLAHGLSLSTSRTQQIQLQRRYHSKIGMAERQRLIPYHPYGLVPPDTTAEMQRPVPSSGPCYFSSRRKAMHTYTYIVIPSVYFSRRRGCGITGLMIHSFSVQGQPTCLFGPSYKTGFPYNMSKATQAILEMSLQMLLQEHYEMDHCNAVCRLSTSRNGTTERLHL